MELKVFRLKDGKLMFAGTREARQGDCILEGSTSMSEISPGELGLVDLHEASTSDFPMYFKTEPPQYPPTPPTQAELAKARQSLKDQGKQALAKSYKDAHPGCTDAEAHAFAWGRNPDPAPESLEASIRRTNPNWTDAQVETFLRGR